ncbi:unnamed protein product [Hermetia illucens]|uniref:Nucleolar protein 16 n=1 Tax=Hermetia illucens TaxID=343691 RepID=A0A7R8V5A1_HERIL|nr:nucleolar protein 16 [Hermetia illucens]CAD7092729.1 unnamed protein product [Hermetia illucens]
MKIRKVKRSKTYRYNVNRKRLRKTRTSTGKIKCRTIKENWAANKSIKSNLREMGLAVDPNLAVGIPNTKQERMKIVKLVNGFVEEDVIGTAKQGKTKRPPRKAFVVQELEKEAKMPRESQFRLPRGVVKDLEYFLDKFKFNYNAMVTDRRNVNQLTWRQFRAKVKKFMSIPEQFNEYLRSKNLTKDDLRNWEEYDTDEE